MWSSHGACLCYAVRLTAPRPGTGPNANTPGPRTDTAGMRWDATAVLEITLMSSKEERR